MATIAVDADTIGEAAEEASEGAHVAATTITIQEDVETDDAALRDQDHLMILTNTAKSMAIEVTIQKIVKH